MRLSEMAPDGASQQMGGALADALDAIDLGQEVCFQRYTREVLPIDGYVFWQPVDTCNVPGALHVTQEIDQGEDETYGAGTITFTTKEPVVQFVEQPIDELWVGSFKGLRFAFPQQQGFFSQVGLWHYYGRVISPIMARQLLDHGATIDATRAITSNSLPLWLALNTYVSPFQANPAANKFLLYPAKLVPPNLPPPYGSVMIWRDTALQQSPYIDPATSSSYQLLADRVRIRLFGLQADEGIDFLRRVLLYCGPDGPGTMGLMDANWVSDDNERASPELQVVALEKTIEFRVDYVQARVRDVAWQLIKNAQLGLIVQTPSGAYETLSNPLS
jgi:hypothetical protein